MFEEIYNELLVASKVGVFVFFYVKYQWVESHLLSLRIFGNERFWGAYSVSGIFCDSSWVHFENLAFGSLYLSCNLCFQTSGVATQQ